MHGDEEHGRALLRVMLPLLVLTTAVSAFGGEAWQRYVDRARFGRLALRIAPNVDVFRSLWEHDPGAEVYGGSSRDFFWWLRRQLATCKTAICVEDVLERLSGGAPIEARSFLLGNSDIDVLGEESARQTQFDAKHFTRIDVGDRNRFAPKHRLYEEERNQGALPLEKIRLGHFSYFPAANDAFDGGVDDIYSAKPRMVLTETIRETDGFRSRENHPVLLVLRWIRQVGVAYAHRCRDGLCNDAVLKETIDLDALERATEIATTLAAHPEELKPFFENPRFVARLNRARARLFQGFTHIEAARKMYELVGLDLALVPFTNRLEPFLSVTFRKNWSAAEMASHRARLAESTAVEPLGTYFQRAKVPVEATTNGELEMFHGTPSAATYRNIVTNGILPSERGSAGMGVYSVDRRSSEFAKRWRDPSGNGYAIRLLMKADATFVDLTSDAGKALFEAFKKLQPSLGSPWTEGYVEDAMANFLGIDVLKYSYNGAHAYVIKNGGSVVRTEAWSKPLRSLLEVRAALQASTDPKAVLRAALADDESLGTHFDYLLSEMPVAERIALHMEMTPTEGFDSAITNIETLNRYHRKYRHEIPAETWRGYYATIPIRKLLRALPEEHATRTVAAVAEAWEFFPVPALLEEHKLLDATHRGGCIERTLREHRGWMQQFLEPARHDATIIADLNPFLQRPLLYVELLEYLERERPTVFTAAQWKSVWGLADFDAPFLRMYMHVPKERTHGPLLAPARLRDLLRAAFRIAPKAPQVLAQLKERSKHLQDSRLWDAIDETLMEIENWAPEHSLFLVQMLPDLPDASKAWDLLRQHHLTVATKGKLVGRDAEDSAGRLVLEAARGRFGSLEESLRVLHHAQGAFEHGGALFRSLFTRIVREAATQTHIDEHWREPAQRAAYFAAAFGTLPEDLTGTEAFVALVGSIADTGSTTAHQRLKRWAAHATCGEALSQ